jgi:hypothetical protein
VLIGDLLLRKYSVEVSPLQRAIQGLGLPHPIRFSTLGKDAVKIPAMIERAVKHPVKRLFPVLIDVIVSILFKTFPPAITDALRAF